jgi:VanZ family protein
MIRKIIIYYLPWLAIMAAIFIFSSIPELIIVEESIFDLIFRKLAHIFVFFLLFTTSYRLFKREKVKKVLFWAVVFTIIYAISDEYHQSFVFGRVGAISDVLVDSLGVLSAYLLLSYNRAFRNFLTQV